MATNKNYHLVSDVIATFYNSWCETSDRLLSHIYELLSHNSTISPFLTLTHFFMLKVFEKPYFWQANLFWLFLVFNSWKGQQFWTMFSFVYQSTMTDEVKIMQQGRPGPTNLLNSICQQKTLLWNEKMAHLFSNY